MIWGSMSLVLRGIIKNKKRTASLAVCILLSIVLITSVEILVRGVVNASVESNGKLQGKYHGSYRNVRYEDLNKLEQNEKVDEVGTTAGMGLYKSGEYTVDITGVDTRASSMLDVEVIEGKYPESSKDIMVEQWVLDKIFPGIKVGDTIKFPFIMLSPGQENQKALQDVEFNLCGIIGNSMGSRSSGTGKAYTNLECVQGFMAPEEIKYKQYFTIKSGLPVEQTMKSFNDYYGKNIIGDYELNNGFINVMEIADKSRYIVIFMDIIIAAAAAVMIYNIFNISIIERLRHFGILRSIGITPLQIKVMVFGEALILALLFIPLGIILGVNFTGVLINMIGGIGDRKLVIDSSSYNIVSITVIGLMSIIVSAYKPARLAARVSPIEALRSGSDELKHDTHDESLLQRMISLLSGYTGKMAYMNVARNKKRFISTVISISMGILIFISINYFTESIDPVKSVEKDIKSDYIMKITDYSQNTGFSGEQVAKIENIPGVEKVEKYKFIWGSAKLSYGGMTDEGRKKVENMAVTMPSIQRDIQNGLYTLNVNIVGCSKEYFSEMMDGMGAKTEPGQMNCIVIQEINGKSMCDLKPGSSVGVTWSVKNNEKWDHLDNSFTVDAILKEAPFKIGGFDADLILITDEESLNQAFGLNGYQNIGISLVKDVKDKDMIEQKLEYISQSLPSHKLISYSDDLDRVRKTKFQVTSILYALFATAVLVALINIINTININVITRKKEFGMLRAIGMTKGQLKKMIVTEGIIYGLTGSIIGSILGIGISYIIYSGAKGTIVADMSWGVDYGVLLLVFIVSIFITTAATLIPLKRATSMNVVESVRAVE